jgi:hypothetical protein
MAHQQTVNLLQSLLKLLSFQDPPRGYPPHSESKIHVELELSAHEKAAEPPDLL